MKYLDKIPLLPLAVIAIFLLIAPYPREPMPHLFQKITMLMNGTLSRPIDIFDLFQHGLPITLLVLKLIRMAMLKAKS